MNFYMTQARKVLDDAELQRTGKIDAATLAARGGACRAAAAMINVEIKKAVHGQMLDVVREDWRKELSAKAA